MRLVLMLLLAAAVAQRQTASTVFETSTQKIRVVTVADGLSNPWSLAFLPGGDMLVSERTGAQLRMAADYLRPRL